MTKELVGRLTPIPGLDNRYRITRISGELFEEGEDLDNVWTLTIELNSFEEGESFISQLRDSL